MPAEGQVMAAAYDPWLVALSVLISILGSYAAVALCERVRDAHGWAWLAWLAGGAVADGIATWSMHYTGMLAFRLPVEVRYHWPTVLLSLLVGILGSTGALLVLSRTRIGWLQLVAASVFLGGVGITGLHYTAMAAMRMHGHHHYSPVFVTLSAVLAIGISLMALTLLFVVRDDSLRRRARYNGSALLRGSANPVMHYVAMAAATFTYSTVEPEWFQTVRIESLGILGNSIVPVMVLVVALLTLLADRFRNQRVLLQHLSRRLLHVQEEERRHLARELHDEFGQILAAITLHLHAARGLAGEAALSRLEKCATLLQQAGERVRSMALELRPTMLDALGLEATLRWLAEQHQQRTGIPVQVVGHLSGAPLSGELAIACFRVAQEALTNVARHAQARHVWISLNQTDSALELVVSDDGKGFDVLPTREKAARGDGLGLLGMSERVQILGGSLVVESQRGRGTRIRASFPLTARLEEHPAEPLE